MADIGDGDYSPGRGQGTEPGPDAPERVLRSGRLVIPVSAYEHFLRDNSPDPVIKAIVEGTDFGNSEIVNEASERIREIILTHPISEELSTSLTTACSSFDDAALFAVRSSAIAEDKDVASFAGQQDTFLNVRSMNVAHSARRCWASYWTARAMTYRHDRGVDHTATGIAVVVQSMVDAVSSGIMFTVDPISRKDQVVIEASWGLGESIASGIVSPTGSCSTGERCSWWTGA